MVRTCPTSTLRKRITVLPGSKPSAVWNRIRTLGPRSSTACTAIQPPMSAASAGTIQTRGSRTRPRRATASGTDATACGSGVFISACNVPYQSHVERLRRKHAEHNDRGKRKSPWTRIHGRQRPQSHQRDEDGDYKDIKHRPATDELQQPEQPRAFVKPPGRADMHAHEQQRH